MTGTARSGSGLHEQTVFPTGVLYPNFVAQRTFSERTDILSPPLREGSTEC